MLQYLKKLFYYVFDYTPFVLAREIQGVIEEHRAAPRRRRLKKAARRSRRHKK